MEPKGDFSGLVSYIKDNFEEFKKSRQPFEDKAKELWFNFLGQYQANLNWRNKEGEGNRSRIFIKVTTLKCNTAHAKISEAIGNDISFKLEEISELALPIGKEIIAEIIKRREEFLHKHLKDISFMDIVDREILNMTIFGDGILKGPILISKQIPVIERKMIAGIPAETFDVSMSPYDFRYENQDVWVIDAVPWWEYYTDCNAIVNPNRKAIGEIHFKRLLPAEVRSMCRGEGYIKENVKYVCDMAYESDPDDKKYEQLGDNYTGESGNKDKRVSLLEWWGLTPVKYLKNIEGVEIPEGVGEDDDVEAVVLLGGDGKLLKAQVNYLGKRAFHVCPFKRNPNMIYSEGVASLMRDSQKMINSTARMIIDNKALSGNGMIAINQDRINWKKTNPSGKLEIYPRKVITVKGNYNPRDCVDSIAFPDVTAGLKDWLMTFMQFADEETGIPKYAQGEGASFLNKTATGMSMLISQMNINLKPVLKNIDEYWIEPIIEAFDSIFMTMGMYPKELQIPLKVKALGMASLMAKEILAENLLKLLQITQNPQDAILLKRPQVIREIAKCLNLSDFVNDDQQIQQIMESLSSKKEPIEQKKVAIEKLYPQLTREEQQQILGELGIAPSLTPEQEQQQAMAQQISSMAAQQQPPAGNTPPAVVPSTPIADGSQNV